MRIAITRLMGSGNDRLPKELLTFKRIGGNEANLLAVRRDGWLGDNRVLLPTS